MQAGCKAKRPARPAVSTGQQPLDLVAAAHPSPRDGDRLPPGVARRVLWDDNAHLTRPDLRSTAGLARIWFDVGATQQYYPVVHSAFWMLASAGGRRHVRVSPGQHLAARGLGVPRADPAPASRPAARCLAAVIFALHPMQVESVAWMTELKNTLSGRLRPRRGAVPTCGSTTLASRRRVSRATVLFIAALLSKSVTAVLPAALLVICLVARAARSPGAATSSRCSPSSRRPDDGPDDGLVRARAERVPAVSTSI